MKTREERQREAYRLSKLTGREVEFRRVFCDCDEWKYCVHCGGNGSYFIPVYVSCGHSLLDDDREEECYQNFCKEREQVQKSELLPLEGTPLKSLRESQSERDAQEAA